LSVAERILLLAMLPAVSVTKDDVVASSRVDSESFQLPHPPSVVTSRPCPSPVVDVPWPAAPRITRTAATPMATPQGSPPALASELAGGAAVASRRSLVRDTLTVDRLSPSASPASPGTVRARVSAHLLSINQSIDDDFPTGVALAEDRAPEDDSRTNCRTLSFLSRVTLTFDV